MRSTIMASNSPMVPDMAERRHGAAQTIGLGFGKFRRDDGEAHRLFLEQRHAERAAQHLLQFVARPMSGAGDG